MKTCPVCQAKAFDDAVVCYGCLFRYDELDPDPECESLDDLGDSGANERSALDEAGKSEAACVSKTDEPDRDTLADGKRAIPDRVASPANRDLSRPLSVAAGNEKPAFFIKLIPVLEETGAVTWSCAVELMAG